MSTPKRRPRRGPATRRGSGTSSDASAGVVVGAVLLASSQVWTSREKLIGLLVVPAGLLPAFLYLNSLVRMNSRAERAYARTTPPP